jgi:hypothetical protein
MKLTLIFLAAVLAALAGGWMWGASGKFDVEQMRRALEDRADLAEVRASVLDGRVSVFQLNYGDAAAHFDRARAELQRVQTRLREAGQGERAGQLEVPLAHLKEASRLAMSLDAGAQTAAAQALETLGK